jgi:hypothetical protein
MPTSINSGNLTQIDYIPSTGGKHSYPTTNMNMPMSAEVSRRKDGVEVAKIIELTRS